MEQRVRLITLGVTDVRLARAFYELRFPRDRGGIGYKG
jgi:hypothetical protein